MARRVLGVSGGIVCGGTGLGFTRIDDQAGGKAEEGEEGDKLHLGCGMKEEAVDVVVVYL